SKHISRSGRTRRARRRTKPDGSGGSGCCSPDANGIRFATPRVAPTSRPTGRQEERGEAPSPAPLAHFSSRSSQWDVLPRVRKRRRRRRTMEATEQSAHQSDRRSFLLKGAAVGAAAMGAERLLADPPKAAASGGLTPGDAAILRFLAAAETIETDAWQQYNELGGVQDKEVPGGTGNTAYTAALAVLDSDMAQYIHDNTDDEFTHFTFINAYLKAHGMAPANLEKFRTLPSSTATGAQQIGRLTNLMQLTVDTSWWTRYRSD